MFITHLSLDNYRCFDSLHVNFHPAMTVIVSKNGAGKTSILDAIAIAFGKPFELNDIRLTQVCQTSAKEMEYAAEGVQLKVGCVVDGVLIGKAYQGWSVCSWKRTLNPFKAKTSNKDAKEIIDYGKRLQEFVRTPDSDVLLPLIAYYGAGRSWNQENHDPLNKLGLYTTFGYYDHLEPASSFTTFTDEFKYWDLSVKDMQLKGQTNTEEYTKFTDCIASVKSAVDICLKPTAWNNLEYSLKLGKLVVHHDQHGELPVELLSDGIRNMIGMVTDIAIRATKLNGQLGAQAAAKTPGIVLIDEIDMHLHPEWQQLVLQNLTEAFPSIQFIATTNSPQVLSTVKPENIRVIGPGVNGWNIALPPLAMTYGAPSGEVLHNVMMVDPQPPVREKADLLRLTRLVDLGDYRSVEAVQLMKSLIAALGEQHPQLQRLRRSIQRQEVMKVV